MKTTQETCLRARVLVIGLIAFFGSFPFIAPAQPGTKLWEVTIGAGVRVSPAIGIDGTIFANCGAPVTSSVITNTRMLYAISPQGTTNWTFMAGATIRSAPAIGVDGTIYFGAVDGLYALSPVGDTNWVTALGGTLCSSPAIGADGTIYIVTRTNSQIFASKLHAVSPAGTLTWSRTVGGGGLWGGSEQYASPAIGPDGSIYVSSLSGQLYSISYSGSTNWIFPLGAASYASPAIGGDGTIYIGDDSGKVRAIHRNGIQRWVYTASGIVESTPAIDQAGKLYFGSIGGTFYCLNSNGVQSWSRSSGGISGSAAIAADGTIYGSTFDSQRLFAYSSSGSNLWSFNFTGPAFSSPVIGSDGTIYIGAGAKLYAFAGTAPPQNSSWPMFRRSPHNFARSAQRSIRAIKSLPDGNVEMQLFGETGRVYEVEASTNLTSWEAISSVDFITPSLPFVDVSAKNFPRRYYRLSTSQ